MHALCLRMYPWLLPLFPLLQMFHTMLWFIHLLVLLQHCFYFLNFFVNVSILHFSFCVGTLFLPHFATCLPIPHIEVFNFLFRFPSCLIFWYLVLYQNCPLTFWFFVHNFLLHCYCYSDTVFLLLLLNTRNHLYTSCTVFLLVCGTKKYIDQEPPYLMHQICVLQWEVIKTKNSGAKHQLWGGRGEIKYIAIVDTNTDYKMKDHICYLRVYGLKTGEGNDNIQDYIHIVKLYINWDVLIKAKTIPHSMGINAKKNCRLISMRNRTAQCTHNCVPNI